MPKNQILQRKIAPKIMKASNKLLYLIIFISAFIVLLQYQIYYNNNVQYNNNEVNLRPIERKITYNMTPNSKFIACLNEDETELPPLYIITPTYKRPEQLAEITRLSHTLMLVRNLYWLVIEDATVKNPRIAKILEKSGIRHEYLIAPMPAKYKTKKGAKPRGVSNRNKGLEWIRTNAKTGVFYFADDDNSYDLELFMEIRYTKKVSMFPVGLITSLGVSSPIVKNGVFSGFYDGWIGGRKFAVDMAGFAVSVEFLLDRPKAIMPFTPGFEEDGFLKSLNPFEPKEIELLASNCTKILAWHTQTKKNEPSKPLDVVKFNNSNLILLKQIIV